MTTLTVNISTDFTAETLSGVDYVKFGIINDYVMATFSAGQFDGVQIVPNCHFDSGPAYNYLLVQVGGGTMIDASGWTFSNWTDPEHGSGFEPSDHVLLEGSSRDDTIIGSIRGDEIYGNGGNDTLSGGRGNDLFMISMTDGSDDVRGNAGVDLINLNRAMATANLTIDISRGGLGVDIGDGTKLSGIERLALVSGTGDDVIVGSHYTDRVEANGGNDFVSGGRGNNFLFGMQGNDKIVCSGTDGEFSGGEGVDTLILNRSKSALGFTLDLSSGLDTLLVDGNMIRADFERLSFSGGSGDDVITGGNRMNILNGGGGSDVLTGQDRQDILAGGTGADVLTGGGNADRFVFATLSDSATGSSRDVVTDFVSGLDKVDLRGIGGLNFSGQSSFSNVAGEIIFTQGMANTTVSIDSDGNGDADMEIVFTGLIAFQMGDFLV